MLEITFLSSMLSLLFLLIVSTGVFLFSKKINLPYTVLLVIVWLLLVPIAKTDTFWFINHFKLTPDILFFVFLPVLLFESSYNLNYREMMKNWKTIGSLAVVWLIISSLIISSLLFYLFPFVWLQIPFIVCLLFWTIISATDPVAVLGIFKNIWAPKRLALIFEWESLFNDGTALVLFLIILWVILEWTAINPELFTHGIISFFTMTVWWMLFWSFTWILFSKIIQKVKNNESVEITLTMILAHLTFLLAEVITYYFHYKLNIDYIWISGVISTVMAWIVIWNYGRYKISPKVEHHMKMFWEYFAFISNSLVFILMWLILTDINIDFSNFILPILLVILVISIARAISVYLPIWIINFFKIERNIPLSWQHLLSWGSLRGALALMMAIVIPTKGDSDYYKIIEFQQKVWWNYDFDIRDFILVITIWSIMFTLIVKATSISYIMKKMWVTKLDTLEEFEYEQAKIIANINILEKLNRLYLKQYLTNDEHLSLKNKYENKLQKAILSLNNTLKNQSWNPEKLVKKVIYIYALWIEKKHLKTLFEYNEISEHNFTLILRKISRQVENLESWFEDPSKYFNNDNYDDDIFEKILDYFRPKQQDHVNKYIRNRARVFITRKVIKELKVLMKIDFGFDTKLIKSIISIYEWFYYSTKEEMTQISEKYRSTIMVIESNLTNKTLLKIEEEVIDKLYYRDIITPKLYMKFIEEIEEWIESDINKI